MLEAREETPAENDSSSDSDSDDVQIHIGEIKTAPYIQYVVRVLLGEESSYALSHALESITMASTHTEGLEVKNVHTSFHPGTSCLSIGECAE